MMRALSLGSAELEVACEMAQCIEAMREVFALPPGATEAPMRTRLALGEDRNILVMPSLVRSEKQQAAVKTISIFPGSPVRSMVMLVDGEDGSVRALIEGATLTAIRTGAVSGLACRFLARPDSATLGIIGAGGQAYHQIKGVVSERPVVEAKVFSRRFERSAALAERVTREMRGVRCRAVESAGDCVRGSDVVVTATTSGTPVFRGEDVGRGTLVIAVGAYTPETREVEASLLSRASVFVDSRAACMEEAGELLMAMREGAIGRDAIRGELSELVTGSKEGRRSRDEITFFKSVGLAIEDNAAGWLALRNAEARSIGRWIEV